MPLRTWCRRTATRARREAHARSAFPQLTFQRLTMPIYRISIGWRKGRGRDRLRGSRHHLRRSGVLIPPPSQHLRKDEQSPPSEPPISAKPCTEVVQARSLDVQPAGGGPGGGLVLLIPLEIGMVGGTGLVS